MPRFDALRRRVPGLVSALVIAAGAVAMALWTRGTRPDPLVDFGRELYAPWRLSLGEVLYRDVAWFNGPLSPYVNSLIFRVAGVRLDALIAWNALLLGVTLVGLYRLLATLGDRVAATAGALFFVAVFAFSQYVAVANYNWLTPYSHELTHGLLLSVWALVALHRFAGTGSSQALATVGVLLGLVVLTKPEPALALGVAVAVGIAPRLRAEAGRARRLGILLASLLAPPLLACGLLAVALPPAQAVRGVLGGWIYVTDPALRALPFYRWSLGTDDTGQSLAAMARATGAGLALLAPWVALALVRFGRRPWMPVAAALAAAGLASALVPPEQWLEAGRVLPVIGIACTVAWWIPRAGPAEAARDALARACSVFALVLLAKIALNARVTHYGFVLAAPAALLAVAAGLAWIPAWVARRGGSGAVVRAAFGGVLAATAVGHLRLASFYVHLPHVTVDGAAERLEGLRVAETTRAALALIARRVPEDATLAVVPEGVMINYLSRRAAGTPYVNLMPPEVLMFGEDAMLRAFEAHPPDFVLWLRRDTGEYGAARFGKGYAERLDAWLRSHYQPLEPLDSSERPGLLLGRSPQP